MPGDREPAPAGTKWLDQFLQDWRLKMALRKIPSPLSRLLDTGTHDGAMFRRTGATGVGIGPELVRAPGIPGVTLVRGMFSMDMPDQADAPFEAATALAVVEHIPEDELSTWAKSLAGMMATGGRLIITVPAPAVDRILHVLIRLRLIAGIEAHQHHGFKPGDLDSIFTSPLWERRAHRTFQFGLNHLYVFERLPD